MMLSTIIHRKGASMMETTTQTVELKQVSSSVWKAPGARIIDRSGRKRLPIGRDGYVSAMQIGTIVDKTMLIADVLDSGYAATLFCRPRRFGKTLNMTMLKAFFEAPDAGGLPRPDAEALFKDTDIWEADGGFYRDQQGRYPVVHISFNTVKKLNWNDSLAEIRNLTTVEYARHSYLQGSSALARPDTDLFDRIMEGRASDADFAGSLSALCRMLRAHHGENVVVLIDEYDAPVMAGYTNGYYDEVVSFLKGWLTGALKDGGAALAFACLTGVQRISKESIFSDLNNLYVSTPLNIKYGERYGFTDAEVAALATYLGHGDCMPEAREWYDGYRFGNADVYNPWSVLNYLDNKCSPGAYWGNTSGNSVLGDLVAGADAGTLEEVYSLIEPGGVVYDSLDLGVVFPDLGVREGALWSILYLSGYLTTNDTEDPSDDTRLRPLRIPNREVARLYRNEVVKRFRGQAGGTRQLSALHEAILNGESAALEKELSEIAQHASMFDLTAELPCHMLLMGLLFGVQGYKDPLSNRESGLGRYDIRLEPDRDDRFPNPRPLITIEVKFLKKADSPASPDEIRSRLLQLADEAVSQIADKAYDADIPADAKGQMRWGIAFCGKQVAASCKYAE